ncbi:2-aminomuconic semialdehyde dehydrogenase [Acropora cervicornis]|uniref:2-aminomuconic semialdehyde dehydrogenase n=1 Tax=Acropora cervicornis TaxID=6130 RepID=A0AAD9V3T4_ACRCE|nr:2-aminomuconic semialdehyde dehydrogenase [Acropora cervicornis]
MAHDMLVLDNFINGEFVPCGAHIDSYDPSTGNVYCKVPDSGKEEVDLAVKAAKEAFESWSVTTAEFRAEIMMKIADLIQSRLDEFAEAESKDQGKPVLLAKTVDIPRACLNFRFFASMIINASSLNHSNVLEKVGAVNYCIRCPVGVAGLISPWNLPIYLLTFKIAPAIAAGNTVVCKPSEMTSVTAWMMAKLLNEAGLPPGVCNLVFGRGPKAGSAIVQHPDVPLISFTGSTATGQAITQMSAPFFKKLSLELGGKNAAVIFDDADLEKCISTTVRELKVGSPRDVATNIGALISKEHLAKKVQHLQPIVTDNVSVLGYIKLAVEEGGTIECGEGKDTPLDIPSPHTEGYFMQPTVITGLDDSTRCMQEEIFGPVVSIVPFDSEEEVIKRANGVKYGLAAVVWSENLSRAHRVSQKLQVGTVWCNCWLVRDLNMPFGGFKASGIGRDGAKDSYEFYTEAKTICIKM